MKKLILFALLIFFSQPKIFAQERPVKGDRSFSVGISGINFISFNTGVSRTGSILFKQYIKDDMAIRASGNLNIFSNGTSIEDTANGSATFTSNNSYFVNIAGGLQKSLGTRTRLEPYIGADLALGFQTGKNSLRTETTDASKTGGSNNKDGDFVESSIKTSTPLTVGLIPFIGFNYFITDGIAIGGEFGFGLNMGFTQERKQITKQRINGEDQAEVVNNMNPASTNFSMRNLGFTNIVLSIFF